LKLTDIKWIDGELSNIKYFAIGDSCPRFDDSGVFDISDNGSCSCPDGFSGSTCQDATTLAHCTLWGKIGPELLKNENRINEDFWWI